MLNETSSETPPEVTPETPEEPQETWKVRTEREQRDIQNLFLAGLRLAFKSEWFTMEQMNVADLGDLPKSTKRKGRLIQAEGDGKIRYKSIGGIRHYQMVEQLTE